MTLILERLAQVILNGFSLAMLVMPLAWVLWTPPHPSDEVARLRSEKLLKLLFLCTGLSLLLWAGLFFFGPKGNRVLNSAIWLWPLHFPLMQYLAYPARVARNPKIAQGNSVDAPGSPIRSASLVNRQNSSPIKRWHWSVAIGVYLLGLLVISSRGLFPFDVPPNASGQAVSSNSLWLNWLNLVLLYAFLFGGMLLMAPKMLRTGLLEPEPMVPQGVEELARLYKERREWVVKSLFWFILVAMPALMGTLYAMMVWVPNKGYLIGILGAIGGTSFGLLGAAVGVIGSIKRKRIQRFKQEIESKI